MRNLDTKIFIAGFILIFFYMICDAVGNNAVASFICENGAHYSNNTDGIKMFKLKNKKALCDTMPTLIKYYK